MLRGVRARAKGASGAAFGTTVLVYLPVLAVVVAFVIGESFLGYWVFALAAAVLVPWIAFSVLRRRRSVAAVER
jgi:Flp pilus assembly protein TadB